VVADWATVRPGYGGRLETPPTPLRAGGGPALRQLSRCRPSSEEGTVPVVIRTPLPSGSDGKARRNNWVEAISGRTPRAKAGFIA